VKRLLVFLIMLICGALSFAADEIRIDYPSAENVYAIVREDDGDVWYVAGDTFEAWGTGSRDADDYDIAMVDKGGDFHVGDFDADISAGTYTIHIWQKDGANPDETADSIIASIRIVWNGTVEETIIDSSGRTDVGQWLGNAVTVSGGNPDVNIESIDADAITASAIATDAITATEIAADAIGASELAADAIGSSELAATAATEIIDDFETQSQADPTGFQVNILEVNGTSQTANDNGADINTLITQVGTAGDGLTNIDLPNQTMNITGNITGNLSGSVGSLTGHTVQTGDTYALANGAAGFSAINTDVELILADTGELQTDDYPTSIAAIQTTVDAIEADTEAVDTTAEMRTFLTGGDTPVAKESTLTTIDGIVDNILVDTGTTLDGKIDTVDGNVDDILVDTGTTLPATLATMSTNIDDIETDTGTTLPATLSTIEGKIDTVDDYVDTEVADILTDTETTIPASIATLDGKVDDVDNFIDTEIAEILADTSAQDTTTEIRTLMTGSDTPVCKDSTPLTAAEAEAEAVDALESFKLDELMAEPVTTDLNTAVDDDSALGYIFASSDVASYTRTTDSLEDIRERGDAAWTSGAATALSTTVAAEDTTTSFTLTAGTAVNDSYNDMQCTVTDGDDNQSTETRRISDWTSGRIITVDTAYSFTPEVGDSVVIERAYLGVSVSGGDATAASQASILEDLADIKGTNFVKDTHSLIDIQAEQAANDTSVDTQLADIPTVAEFEARTKPVADYFDWTADTVANVTLVATTTNNTDMRGTDNAATAAALTTHDGKLDVVDNYIDTEVAAIKTTTDKIDDTLEDDGGTYRFTTNALEQSPAASSDATAANQTTIIGLLDTEVADIKTTTDKLGDTLEDDAGTWRFTENALEEAPSGTGGDATAANQATIIAKLPTNYVMGSSDQADHDGGFDAVTLASDGLDSVSVSYPGTDVSAYTFRDLVVWTYLRFAGKTIMDGDSVGTLEVRNAADDGSISEQAFTESGNTQTINKVTDGQSD